MIRALCLLLSASPALAEVRFQDHSDAFGVAHVYSGGWEHFVGGGVAVFDCDGDGRPEVFAAGGEAPARLFLNQSAGADLRFSEAPDFPHLTGVTGAYPLDIDGDGRLDLAVLRVGPNVFLQGQSACRFRDATDDWGLAAGDAWSTAFSATWEAGAARPTLAIGNYVDRDDPAGPFEACDDNQLLRPVPDGYASAPLSPGHCALSMLFSDWTGTGRADLRVSNDRHYYVRAGAEQMWRLDGTPRLLGPGDGFEPIRIWGMGIASRDLTGDGRAEVFLTSMGDQILQIARSEPGYDPAPFSIGTYAQRPFLGDDGRPSTGWHAEFGDIDNDGRADLFIAKGNVDQMPTNAIHDPNNLLMQQADGTFREAALEAGVATGARARGAALADFDGDGRLDLVVVNRRAPMELYRNVTAGTGNWIAVTPRQPGGNGFAIGAKLDLRGPDGNVQRIEVTVGGGHVGGQAGPVHFGIGAAAAAELRVIWPDGRTSDWIELPAGSRAELWRAESGAIEAR